MALFGKKRAPGSRGFVPGARVPDIRTNPMSQDTVFIGNLDGEGAFGRSSALGDFNTEAGVSPGRRPMVQDLPGRRIDTSHRAAEMDARMSQTLEARRRAKVEAADPGLSGRGTRGAPGRRGRPATGGLEGRGTRPAPGTRTGRRPLKVGGLETRGTRNAPGRGARPVAGGLENRGTRPAPGTRMAPGPMHGPTRTDFVNIRNAERRRIEGNIARSRAGRTGGFRASGVGSAGPVSTARDITEGAMHGPGQAELNAIRRSGTTNARQPIMKGMKNKKALMIGAGAAVIGGLAYSGRRGEGSSGGRTSQYRY